MLIIFLSFNQTPWNYVAEFEQVHWRPFQTKAVLRMALLHSLVHCISVEIIQILNSNLEVGTPLALVNGVVKQIDVGV